MKEIGIYGGAGLVGGLISNLFGGWDAAILTLIVFMGIDYVTGMLVAGVFQKSTKTKNGALESHVGWKGICRKGVTLLIILIAHRLDLEMGIPIPKVLARAIEVLKNKSEKESENYDKTDEK